MKTLAKLWKTENLKKRQKSFLIASILTISILPSVPQDLAASGLPSKKPTPVIEIQDSWMNALETELWTNAIEYRAQQFVEAEISLELQTRENEIQDIVNNSAYCETSNLEDLLKIEPYDAGKYVEEEMRFEITNQSSYETFLNVAERITNEGCDQEITRFALALVRHQEQKSEYQSFATAISN